MLLIAVATAGIYVQITLPFLCFPVRIDEISVEKINVLRSRLMGMKHELAKKQAQTRNHTIDDVLFSRPHRNASIIDANFLSVALCGLLGVILSVAVYAFYTLYHAVLKRFPSKHTEL